MKLLTRHSNTRAFTNQLGETAPPISSLDCLTNVYSRHAVSSLWLLPSYRHFDHATSHYVPWPMLSPSPAVTFCKAERGFLDYSCEDTFIPEVGLPLHWLSLSLHHSCCDCHDGESLHHGRDSWGNHLHGGASIQRVDAQLVAPRRLYFVVFAHSQAGTAARLLTGGAWSELKLKMSGFAFDPHGQSPRTADRSIYPKWRRIGFWLRVFSDKSCNQVFRGTYINENRMV